MNNKELNIIKKEILRYLCEKFDNNPCPLFDRKDGFQCYNDTDLTMIMDKVVSGLKSAQQLINDKK